MGMRKRILIAIGITFASLVLMLYLIARVILMESFTELEEQYVHLDVQRAQSALSDELAALDTLLSDWAAWDDTYTFIVDTNEEYIASNLADKAFTDFRLNLILFVNPSDQIIFGKSFDLESKSEIPVPQSLQDHLPDDALLRHLSARSSIRGIMLLPEGPLLIASRPILTSEKEGPIRGTMIMGRYLDSAKLERLAQITHLSLALYRLDDAHMPPDFQAARSSLLSPVATLPQEMSVFIQPLNAESVAGYTLLKDIYSNPGLVLRVDMPRDIYRRGQASMLYLVFLLLFGGMAFTGMTSWVADKALISRLVHLNADVNSIGASGDLSARVSMAGRDELSDLASAINGMLAALERFQSELRESERSLKQRHRELSTLYEAATAISSDLSLSVVLQTVAEQLTHALNSSGCALSLWNRDEGQVETLVNYSTHWPDETEPTGAIYDLADYPAAQRVLETSQPIVIQHNDPPADEAEMASIKQYEAYALLMLPLLARDRVVGLVELIDDVKERDYTPEDIRLAESLAVHAAIAIENARLYERMRAARDRLQALSRQLVEVQEAERRHVARELHDEIGQILTVLKLVVEMSTTLPADEVGASLDKALTLINELAARVRSLSLDMRPTTLDNLGLVPALRWHFERYTTQTNVRVTFKHTGVEGCRFAPEIETAVYRIVQEALTNVARHSGASEVTARLWADQDTLGVQIEDHGVGFDTDTESMLASSGLSGMCERAALLGSQLTIETAPEAGTRLTAEFPLTPSSTASSNGPAGGQEGE